MLVKNNFYKTIFQRNFNSDLPRGIISPSRSTEEGNTNDGHVILNDLAIGLSSCEQRSNYPRLRLSEIRVDRDPVIDLIKPTSNLFIKMNIHSLDSEYFGSEDIIKDVYLTEHSLNQLCSILFRAGVKVNSTLIKSLPSEMAVEVLNKCLMAYSFFCKNIHSDNFNVNYDGYARYMLSHDDFITKVEPNRVRNDYFDFYVTRDIDTGRYILNSINSLKYTRIKNVDIVERISNMTKENASLVVSKIHHSDFCLAIKVIDINHPIQLDPKNLDDIGYVGVEIINSEIGTRKLTIRRVIFRKVCSNGMWGFDTTHTYNKKHIGSEIKNYVLVLQDYFHDLLHSDGSDAKKLSHKFAIAQNRLIATSQEEREKFLKYLGLRDKEIEAAITNHATEEKKDMRTAFDVIQAITAAARVTHSVERRSELEYIAGEYFGRITA